MRTRAERRKLDFKKAIRKKNICEKRFGFEQYDNVHQYSKNKIHCSCPLCTAKTNWGFRKYYTHSDQIKIDSMNEKETEFGVDE